MRILHLHKKIGDHSRGKNSDKWIRFDDNVQGLTSERWHWLYESSKGGRRLTSIKDSMDASIRLFEDNIKED